MFIRLIYRSEAVVVGERASAVRSVQFDTWKGRRHLIRIRRGLHVRESALLSPLGFVCCRWWVEMSDDQLLGGRKMQMIRIWPLPSRLMQACMR